MRAAALVTAVALTTACSYEFRNPAEALRAGEVRGRVLADAGAGVSPNAGIDYRMEGTRARGQQEVPPGLYALLGRRLWRDR